jgi:hypothetical protein
MANQDFKVFSGKFFCKKCNEEVTSLRFWPESGDTTWMCTKKHISKVELAVKKKTKKDFLNE